MVGGKFRGRNRSASGDSFHGVRPLRPEDPVKLIHWPSSSKGQGIMVREFDEELAGRVGIVMDASPGRLRADSESLLDWTARAAASLMLAALDAGHHVQFIDLAHPTPLSVPPFSDGGAVLERLARLHARPGCLTAGNIRAAVEKLPQRCGLCFVLTRLPETVGEPLREFVNAGRRVSLYVPTEVEPDIEELPVSLHRYGAWELHPEMR